MTGSALWLSAAPIGPITLLGKLALIAGMAVVGGLLGVAIGGVQFLLLRHKLTRLRRGEWLGPTIAVMLFGWLLGSGLLLFAGNLSASLTLGIGAAVGLLFGLAQWLVLRRHAERAGLWIGFAVPAWVAAIVAMRFGGGLGAMIWPNLPGMWGSLGGGLCGSLIVGLLSALAAMTLRPWVPRSAMTLRDQVAVVTGGNAGIGYEIALGLARLGAKVVLLCRDEIRGAAAASAIRMSVLGAEARTVVCDLGQLASIRAAASRLNSELSRVDILIHNAGATFGQRTASVDGIEATLALDVVGPLLLTNLLGEKLESCAGRVITLTDLSHRKGEIELADLHFIRREYDEAEAHAQAQRGRVLFTTELGRRMARLRAVAVYPGAVRTQALLRAPLSTRLLAATVLRPLFMRAELGALPVLRLALLPPRAIPSGRFFDRFTPDNDVPDAAFAQAFFIACEKLTVKSADS